MLDLALFTFCVIHLAYTIREILKMVAQGGHGTGKTGNLVLTFSIQTGKTQGILF